jgi:hypothetical protein
MKRKKRHAGDLSGSYPERGARLMPYVIIPGDFPRLMPIAFDDGLTIEADRIRRSRTRV